MDGIDERMDTQDIAYIVQTSGTTGKPKPILVPHASIVPNIQDFNATFQLNKDDVVFLSSPLTFDPSILDILLSLLSGAQLLVIPTLEKIKPRLYSTLFLEYRVSVLQCTPSLLQNIFRHAGSDTQAILPSAQNNYLIEKEGETSRSKNGSLRILAVGGEKCSFQARDILKKLCNEGISVYHLYGLTEMSVWQSMVRLGPGEVDCMPVYIKNRNLITQTQISCQEGAITLSSKTR